MKFPVYCVRDIQTGFEAPMIDNNVNTAIRNFKLYAQSKPIIRDNPQDFFLYKIGSFDSDTGELTSVLPTEIAKASDFLRKDE